MYIIMCTMCTVHFTQTFTFPLGRKGIVCIWYIIRVYARSYRSPRCHITLLLCYHPVNTVIECTRLQKLFFFLFPEPYSIYDGHSAYTITVLGFQSYDETFSEQFSYAKVTYPSDLLAENKS